MFKTLISNLNALEKIKFITPISPYEKGFKGIIPPGTVITITS